MTRTSHGWAVSVLFGFFLVWLTLGYAQLIDRQQRTQMLHFISEQKSETWSSGAALRQRQLNLAFNKHGTQSKMESVSESAAESESELESEPARVKC